MKTTTSNDDQAVTALPRASAAPSLTRIVLTGFMGAGKSTVGRRVAERLGWGFLDLDALVEERAGSTVAALFAERGEEHFRRLESRALAAALGRSEVVLALGGGTAETLTNRLLLEQTPDTGTVFLDAPFEVLFDRCVLQAIDRPVLADADRARTRYMERRKGYRRLARWTIDTEPLTPDETVEAVLAAIKK